MGLPEFEIGVWPLISYQIFFDIFISKCQQFQGERKIVVFSVICVGVCEFPLPPLSHISPVPLRIRTLSKTDKIRKYAPFSICQIKIR